MTRIKTALAWHLATTALMAGCASQPPAAQPAQAVATCSELEAEIARAEQIKREASGKQQDAWKAVVPFVVAARYASGKSAIAEADQRLGELRDESARQGCTSRPGR